MYNKKTNILKSDVEIENKHSFSELPNVLALDLSWNLTVIESTASVSFIFSIPSQNITAKGEIENEEGDYEDVYFNINITGDKVKVLVDSSTKLIHSDIAPQRVEMVIESLIKLDSYSYEINVESLSVTF
jgi:hypothetical protein